MRIHRFNDMVQKGETENKNTQHIYRNNPKFSNREVWENRADPDQTAPRSGSTLFVTLFLF